MCPLHTYRTPPRLLYLKGVMITKGLALRIITQLNYLNHQQQLKNRLTIKRK
jgi:hypothetical protein